MSSAFKLAGFRALVAALAAVPMLDRQPAQAREPLRVCADPNNLPFSNERGEGFENAIAELAADDLGRPLAYTWWPQRRGFIRNTLAVGRCDVVIGVPAGFELAATTEPYYRSIYAFVTKRGGIPPPRSLDDPALRRLRIGLHVIGDDYSNVPPAQALANRGIVDNVRGYRIHGDYSQPNPPAALIEAVAAGEIDVPVAWGPLAGYFASRQPVPLDVRAVMPERDGALAFAFDIAMGVRREDAALRAVLDEFLVRRRADVDAILGRFGVPLPGIAGFQGNTAP